MTALVREGYPSRMKGGHEKTPEVTTPTLPLGFCFVDQESGAHTTRQTDICMVQKNARVSAFTEDSNVGYLFCIFLRT